jgi:hypothetical protein
VELMTWTQSELDALKAAYASGTTRVTYEGKTVEYDSEAALLRRIQTIESAISATAGASRPVAGFASFDNGDQ